ncbi:hypothetical protein R1flu_026450 [Riccia fluitans]|uniref:Uncharacterized protein n=1 Tax=Riccia fluitans TaxID=41844 RepID=A0ABD1XG05_9MARC
MASATVHSVSIRQEGPASGGSSALRGESSATRSRVAEESHPSIVVLILLSRIATGNPAELIGSRSAGSELPIGVRWGRKSSWLKFCSSVEGSPSGSTKGTEWSASTLQLTAGVRSVQLLSFLSKILQRTKVRARAWTKQNPQRSGRERGTQHSGGNAVGGTRIGSSRCGILDPDAKYEMAWRGALCLGGRTWGQAKHDCNSKMGTWCPTESLARELDPIANSNPTTVRIGGFSSLESHDVSSFGSKVVRRLPS